MLYIACPYAHDDPAICQYRYETACRVAAILIKSGIVVFSPLSHSVSIAQIGGIGDTDHEFWMSQDLPILHRCDELLILGLSGWKESLGVQRELFESISLQKPITLIEEADIELLPHVQKSASRFLESKILPLSQL